MALNKEQMREYMRKRRTEKREKNLSGEGEHQPPKNEVLQPADHAGTTVDGNDLSFAQLSWDKKKYPNRGAWEIAVGRVERAVRYAQMFPNLIGSDDLKFQTVDWQHVNEGLKAPTS